MTDLDRLLELQILIHVNQISAKELDEHYALKNKIEQDLKYWQKYKDETREVEHIISKRNLELSHVKPKIKELEQQNKVLGENIQEIKQLKEEIESLNNILDIYKKWGDGMAQKLENIKAILEKYQ